MGKKVKTGKITGCKQRKNIAWIASRKKSWRAPLAVGLIKYYELCTIYVMDLPR